MRTIILLFPFLFACSPPASKTPNKEDCTQFVCPMHSDKTSTKHLECPQCGMQMVPIENKSEKDT